jgi:DNA-binding NtrC family response regulator
VRDLVAWLDARGGGATALIRDEEVCVGALLWPAAGRVSPLSFEEVTLMRHLADHLGAATESAAQLARARAREIDAEQAMHDAVRRAGELERALDNQQRRQRALAEHLARPARVACYSGAAQTAVNEAERHGQSGLPLALLAPLGVDTLSWAALIHLASARRDGPLVVVDATVLNEQSLERWSDPERSPLEEARSGTLVVLDAHALPAGTQRYLATTLSDETGVIAVLAPGHAALDEHLAARLGDRVVALPALADRAEDLRALALHQLARFGMRLRGGPFGLSLQAQELLNEYAWPGNDAELEAVLVRAALAAESDVVQAEELVRIIGDGSLGAVASGSGPRSSARAKL